MRSIANRIVGGATPASSQNGLRSPMPAAQWRTASRVAVSMYGSGRRTGVPIRRRSAASASSVITGKLVCLLIESGPVGGLPELPRRAARAFGHAGELRPGDVRIDGRLADPRTEAAIGSSDDVLAADQTRVAADALGDQVRMLDEVGRRVEHARDENLAGGQLHALEQPPLVRVPWIRGLERDARRPRGEDDVDDVGERDVVVVRPLVVA